MNPIVFPLSQGMKSPAVGDLQTAVQLFLDRNVILRGADHRGVLTPLLLEHRQQLYGATTGRLVSSFQQERRLTPTGIVDESTANAMNVLLRELGQLPTDRPIDVTPPVPPDRPIDVTPPVPPDQPVDVTPPVSVTSRRIEGRVVLQQGVAAEQLKVRLYRRDFGGDEKLLAEGTTQDGGQYALQYDVDGAAPGLEVRAVDAAGNETPLSRTLHDVATDGDAAVVDLVAPSKLQPLAPEYTRLAADVTAQVGDVAKLADARENTDRQDLTVLNRATGWDARVLALAATAAKLGRDGQTGLSQDVLYGLVRAGLPTEVGQLARVSADAAGLALAKVRDAGIVDLTDEQIGAAKNQFAAFVEKTRLATPVPGSTTTYGEMLDAAVVSDAGRQAFTSVFVSHRGDAAGLWTAAADAGVPASDIQALQRQGKLAFLTGNSAAVTARLQQGLGIADPVELVDRGFHRAERWTAEIKTLAGDDAEKLAALISARIRGREDRGQARRIRERHGAQGPRELPDPRRRRHGRARRRGRVQARERALRDRDGPEEGGGEGVQARRDPGRVVRRRASRSRRRDER